MAREIIGYFVDAETRERLEFQYNPSEIGDDKSSQFADIKIPGISHPKYQFVAGGARQITCKLFFFKGDVKKQVAWLQSLLYPEHSGTLLKSAPHRVVFIFGELYPGIVCIVRNVKVRYFNLFDQNSLAPQQAEVDVTLDEWVETSVNYHIVRG
ncbi:MAG: hypothetical protein HZA78_08025 [Candidatus Schekmanbacteria bacterium]|nr:hypothetical protein [Candidatus Schekmanbacteria bacterium]